MKKLALDGVRIADFTWAGAGPYATLLLGFLGAEVIKVESRRRLDGSRRSGSRDGKPVAGVDQSASFNDLNLNKLSITADLKQPRALELIKRVIGVSDAVIDNFRPGVMDRLGLGYPVLKEINPSIVMLSSSAFGATGPDARYGGWAFIFAALAGLSHITGYPDGIPTELRLVMDLTVGSMSAYCLLAALQHRRKTGRGQFIDLSSRQTLSCCMGEVLLDYAMNKRNQSR
ncbi:MAG: CoA transferase, partial [Chloroflexota bacterium]